MLLKRGITLVELIIVLGIIGIILTFSSINLLAPTYRTSLATSVNQLITDLKQQQLKAMIGDTEGRTDHDSYGVHFETNSYTLFHGSYAPGNPDNFTIKLGDNIRIINTTFPQSQVTFAYASGETGSGSNTITLKNILSGEGKTLTINRYGAIIRVN